MNVGTALKITCVGFAGGVLLRAIQMLYCFDYSTGFYTDGGVMAWCTLALLAAVCVSAGVLLHRSRRYLGPYTPRKNTALGVTALISGAVLLVTAVMELTDYMAYLRTGVSSLSSVERGPINAAYLAFIAASMLFGAVQVFVSLGFFRGKNVLETAPLIYLVGVFWGVVYLILVYALYAKTSLMLENFFVVVGASSTLLALFYLCKLFAGVDDEAAAKWTFIAGIASVVITVTYSFTNLALLLLGRSYTGEMPPPLQLASLGVAVYLLVFLFTYKNYSIRPTPRQATGEFPALTPEQMAEMEAQGEGGMPGDGAESAPRTRRAPRREGGSGAGDKPRDDRRRGRRFRPN